MVRPSAASLNSLAELLRQVSQLYRECRSILNYLDADEQPGLQEPKTDSPNLPKCESANGGAASIPRNTLELRTLDRKNIM